MIRTQIQLPDALHDEVRRVAEQQEWSIAEVIRRGAEAVVRAYPPTKAAMASWSLPPPLQSRLLVKDAQELKATMHGDYEARIE